MLTDPIADMLTRIRNAMMAGHSQTTIPYSKIKESVAKVIISGGYLKGFETVGEGAKKMLVVELKYNDQKKTCY